MKAKRTVCMIGAGVLAAAGAVALLPSSSAEASTVLNLYTRTCANNWSWCTGWKQANGPRHDWSVGTRCRTYNQSGQIVGSYDRPPGRLC